MKVFYFPGRAEDEAVGRQREAIGEGDKESGWPSSPDDSQNGCPSTAQRGQSCWYLQGKISVHSAWNLTPLLET